ncbi:tRNA (guanosine(37)-N1)-methyltransferase TrmD [Brachybacterium nesterenkovii]|uniref:tRNA (guanosine(37)-N1)-methyltransferase TrmD n=1 Tax=Brachybacterium nesterenkovii TaxID=47847 RepID=UPI00321BE6D0
MRIDVITIFPEYLAPLELSLIGKARRDGLVDLRIHQLRDFTHDRHRTVDDTPLGGGAGMVMKPEPWAEAFAAVLAEGRSALGEHASPLVIFPNPAGEPFAQATAQDWSARPWLVFACGRYEGIDERVYEHLADAGIEVALASLGDYVLNGGEVAVLAITEAVVRLVPGVVGNAASLVEESHSDGLLEYPLYTRPAAWTGPDGTVREVPEVLLSGNHARIAAWRAEQSLARTAERRPDLIACREGAQQHGAGDAPDTAVSA